jgi:protein involved in polysaccharide export with SLBB domain
MRSLFAPAVLAVVAVVAAGPLSAQQTATRDPSRVYLTRGELDSLRARYGLWAESPAYSPVLRAEAQDEADRIGQRLEDGDFQVGDRVWLSVEGEDALIDTFTVTNERDIVLPELGRVSLAGVLRAELADRLREYVGRFVREPRVQARSLIRVAIEGAVPRPGFYTVPSEALISDALMLAGGPSPDARPAAMRVERGLAIVWSGQGLQDAIAAGSTLDQLSILAGDRLVVPRAGSFGHTESMLRTVSMAATLPLTIVAIVTIF